MNPVEKFEHEMCKWLGCRHARAVNSGTAALHSALLALGVERGDKVITTPFTFVSTANAILMCGATPIFADIDEFNYCIDAEKVALAYEEHPEAKGILAVHLFGNTCDLYKLSQIAETHDGFLIEDASQALGTKYGQEYAGTVGDAGTLSFYASKNLWGCFQGGMVLTDDDVVAEAVSAIRRHGIFNGKMVRMGYNYEMNWLSAFIGETQVRLHKEGILAELGKIGTQQGYYPRVVYDEPYYKTLEIKGDCPVAENAARMVREELRARRR